LDPDLLEILRFAKEIGYFVFLDTNGSRPDVVDRILREESVDVVGLSIKGIDRESAMEATGVSPDLCWTSPLHTLRLASDSDIVLLVTYVCNENTSLSDLSRLSDLVPRKDNVFLKFNNLMDDRSDIEKARPLPQQEFDMLVDSFVSKHPELAGHIIRISDSSCVTDRDRIGFS